MMRIGMALVIAMFGAGCASIESEPASAAPRMININIAPAAPTNSTSTSELMFQLMAGELAGQFDHLDNAAMHYMRATRLSNDPQVAERATNIALYAQDDSNALTAARRWMQLAPSNVRARQTLGVLLVRKGEVDAALPQLEFVIQHAPGVAGNGFMLIGAILSQEGNSKAALDAMRMLVQRHAEEPLSYYALSNLSLSAGKNQQAVAAADKALALQPSLIEAQVVRAHALLASGETGRAITGMSQAVESAPHNYELRLTFAKMLVQVEHFDRARAEFAKLLGQRPNDPDLLYTLGLLDVQKQNYAGAGKYFKRLLATGQRIDEARYYLGRVAQELKRLGEAIRWYSQVQTGQYRIDAQARIASVLAIQGKLNEGREELRRARLEEGKDTAVVQLYLAEGELLRKASRYEAGLNLFNQALNEYPGNSDLLYARALLAEKIGRTDQLEADLRTILKADPNNATALNALGFTLADHNKRVHEALGYIEQAYEQRPDDPAIIDSMGWAHFRLGNYDQAEQYLRRAFKLLPDGEIAGHLSEIMWAQGQKEKARSVLRHALDRQPQQKYLLKLHDRYTK
jgi:tetratricopeptide (TPR) repeat protein